MFNVENVGNVFVNNFLGEWGKFCFFGDICGICIDINKELLIFGKID